MRRFVRQMVTAGAVSAMAFGGVAALAPTASASEQQYYVSTTVKYRKSPGGAAKGQLAKGTKVCPEVGKGSWSRVLVKSGAHKGGSGWVADKYIKEKKPPQGPGSGVPVPCNS